MDLEGITASRTKEHEKYARLRWWAGLTLGDLLDKAADVYPQKEALIDGQVRFTYGRLRETVDGLAGGLLRLGIAPAERVLVQLPNWHEFILAYFALQKIGAVPVILIARYRQYEINHLARSSGATAWIVAERFRRTDYLPIIGDVRRDNPRLARIIVCRGGGESAYTRFEDLLENGAPGSAARQRLEGLRPDPKAIAHMGPTGGTTGVPKIALHTHNSLICKVEYSARASELNSQTICLVGLPAAHDLPFANGICATLFACGKLVLSSATDPPGICETIQQERVNTVIWVPTLAFRMLNSGETDGYDLSSLELIYCGGGASPAELIRKAVERFRCTYLCGYGGTEGMLVTTRRDDDIETLFCSIGKPTCPYDHYRIVDENDTPLPVGCIGQLVVRGPSIFAGYYNMAGENEIAFTPDGYFRTGDLAAMDADGRLRLAGRAKDTIKRGGESIFAAEIEKLMGDHPDIAGVAVIGMPDPELGERVCAVVQPKPGRELTLAGIVTYMKQRGTSVLQLPECLRIVDRMPLTPTGKVDKAALRAGILPATKCSSGVLDTCRPREKAHREG